MVLFSCDGAVFVYGYWWIGLTDLDVNGRFKWTDDSEVIYTNLEALYGTVNRA